MPATPKRPPEDQHQNRRSTRHSYSPNRVRHPRKPHQHTRHDLRRTLLLRTCRSGRQTQTTHHIHDLLTSADPQLYTRTPDTRSERHVSNNPPRSLQSRDGPQWPESEQAPNHTEAKSTRHSADITRAPVQSHQNRLSVSVLVIQRPGKLAGYLRRLPPDRTPPSEADLQPSPTSRCRQEPAVEPETRLSAK